VEKLLQYLDDLDDLFGVVGLITERLRNVIWLVVFLALGGIAAYGAVMLALTEPPLALAMAVMLFVILMYRSVTRPIHMPPRSA
jgi:hypothetical protein